MYLVKCSPLKFQVWKGLRVAATDSISRVGQPGEPGEPGIPVHVLIDAASSHRLKYTRIVYTFDLSLRLCPLDRLGRRKLARRKYPILKMETID